jgi:hypothetical protein
MKKILAGLLTVLTLACFTGCDEASRVRENLAQEANNFNCIRRITVIDCITGDTLFQMEGRSSIVADGSDNQLEIITEYQKGAYSKQIIGLSDNVTYIVEDLETTLTDPYHYKINFNPHMWLPATPDIID